MNLPVRITVAGPSETGKTLLVVDMLKNQEKCFKKKFDKIVWCYGISQPEFFSLLKKTLPGNIEFISGFPEEKLDSDELFGGVENGCIVLGIVKIF